MNDWPLLILISVSESALLVKYLFIYTPITNLLCRRFALKLITLKWLVIMLFATIARMLTELIEHVLNVLMAMQLTQHDQISNQTNTHLITMREEGALCQNQIPAKCDGF
ncbi:hypothetical protein CJP40_06710 [Lactobacillus plantarum]|nr:hypothetical protein LC611_05750 [Lactiplantibacillus plantarum]ASL36202.1 hypothetical protein CBI37_01595 [Lactiplantibacillus plantarum]ASZ32832.1 hypothetical protein CLC99_05880 [Lactiplantibacillus plantarum]ATL78596.1 hypothetical protein CRG99_08500 [Lactiplantibacillus plantarum]AWL15134.1 hypothetical protein DHT46_02825 [Lactiplantibacillus plantarum]